MGVRSPLGVLAAGLLALGSGCVTADAKKSESKKPDVTQPGVLPPPRETTAIGGQPKGTSGVIPASATTTAASMPVTPVVASQATTGAGPSFSKLTAKFDRKMIATEMAVGWQNKIAYLPDPVKSGRMGAGIVGQMFLYGGPKYDFIQADGILTVDLVDDTPRPPGQQAAADERWQFDKNTLRALQTKDETFGKSYVLFLPWPAYRPDITRVRISARYDPEVGHTLFAAPTTLTLDSSSTVGAPVWKDISGGAGSAMPNRSQPLGGSTMPGLGGMPPIGAVPPANAGTQPLGAPIPIGGAPAIGAVPPPAQPGMLPVPPAAPLPPVAPLGVQPGAPLPPTRPLGTQPLGVQPGAMVPPDGLPPIVFTLPPRQ
jgi:hypothetical protein